MLDLHSLFQPSSTCHSGSTTPAGAAAAAATTNTATTDFSRSRYGGYSGTRVAQSIDPMDGKTRACNRNLTFETFVGEQHLGVDEGTKKKVRLVNRIFGKLRGKMRRRAGWERA